MKLEDGKYYLTIDGRKVGPMASFDNGKWFYCDGVGEIWGDDGKNRYSGVDLIAEWQDEPAICADEYARHPYDVRGPVRTVTRKEIVPGVYGKVSVLRSDGWWFAFTDNGDQVAHVKLDRDELTAAIETLTQIRDALA